MPVGERLKKLIDDSVAAAVKPLTGQITDLKSKLANKEIEDGKIAAETR